MTDITIKYDSVKYRKELVRLAQNENPYGVSPKAKIAIQEGLNDIPQYPDDEQMELRQLLADRLNVKISNLTVGAGSVSIIETLIKTFVKKDEHIVFPEVTFAAYKLIAKIFRVDYRVAKLTNYSVDLNLINQLCDNKTKLVFLANPNNPTGTILHHNELKQFIEQLNANTLVVIDEAYIEYTSDPNFPRSIELLNEYPNVIILRSFSKIYGLAGLRIGYGIAHESITNMIQGQRIPFTINKLATIAALASLKDDDFLNLCIRKNEKQRDYLYSSLKKTGYNIIPSQTNFHFLYFDNTNQRDAIYEQLIDYGLQTRKMDRFGDSMALRISIGDEATNQKIIDCLCK